jgi:NAD(P)-dependent dehydrogenase (short-subunit alcohol dehydrogenase family)
MKRSNDKVAVVAGVGDGLGLALCERLLGAGYAVGGLSRSAMPRPGLGDEYLPLPCDLTEPAAVDNAVSAIEQAFGPATVYVHNAAYLLHKAFLQTSARDFRTLWEVACLGAVHGVQRVLPGMLAAGQGSVLFAGATASVKAGGGFAAFASAKFALRGLGQSLAREYGPQGIHVAHVVIDGVIWSSRAEGYGYRQDQCLAPQAIAETFLNLIEQPRSAWTQELDLRPDAEPF